MKNRNIFFVYICIAFVIEGLVFAANANAADDDVDSDKSANVDAPPEKAKYVKPVPKGSHHFVETFESNIIGAKWLKSEAKKADVDEVLAKYDGEWSIEAASDSALDGDLGLVLKSKAKHHAISAKLIKPFKFSDNKQLVIQYEVKFQTPMECGGAYLKLLTDSADLTLAQLHDKTPYTIMFGPDKCGSESKLHFIIRHQNPVSKQFEEKHAKKTENVEPFFNDQKTHLYTLVINGDHTFKIFVDQVEMNSGSLLSDLTPPINPEKEIIDAEDTKPETWDDREKIADPTATKPDDWNEDEPRQIVDESASKPDGWLEDEELMTADPSAAMPDDWDVETDGEWEAPKIDNPRCKEAPGCGKWQQPMIENPKYKGKWRAPLIDNPNYQGKWEPRKIANPVFFEDLQPFANLKPISAVALELWSITDNIYFDNFIVSDDESVASEFAKDSWALKKTEERKSQASESVFDTVVNATKDRPWLWAIYILVILVPVIFIVLMCSSKKSETPAGAEQSEEAAANDAEVEEEADAEAEEEQPEAGDAAPATSDKKNDDAGVEKSTSEQETEQEAPVVDEAAAVSASPSSGKKARKRNVRKE